MKFFLALLLGLGSVSAAACSSARQAEVKAETVQLNVTGMT
jgi:hypothetical protein